MFKNKQIKYGLIAAICILILCGTGFFVTRNNQSKASNDSLLEVVTTVKKGSIISSAGGTGNIAAGVRKEIKTLDKGIVEKIFVEKGQWVEEGDLICTFENTDGDTQLENAQLSLSIQEKKLREMESDLEKLKVYAPQSGVISGLNVNEGEELNKGLTLANVTDNRTLQVIGQFNKTQVAEIKVGDAAEVLLTDSLVTLPGKVTKINSEPEVTGEGFVKYLVTIDIANPGGLSAGMIVQITIKNQKGNISSPETAALEIKPVQKISLKVGGTLKKLYVSSGEYVKSGQLLAELTSDELLLSIETQRLQVKQSSLNLEEKVSARENTVVLAPISGVVSSVMVTEGERVSENTTVAVVSDLKKLEVVIPVDELDIGKVKLGQKAVVTANSLPDKEFRAEVTEIALEGATSSGVTTFDVKLTLEEIEGLKPGMTANANIILEQKDHVLLIPVEAIQQRGKQKFVMVRTGEKDQPVSVETGLASEEQIEILSGLNEKDQVVYTITGSTTNRQSFGPGGGRMMMQIPGGGSSQQSWTRRN